MWWCTMLGQCRHPSTGPEAECATDAVARAAWECASFSRICIVLRYTVHLVGAGSVHWLGGPAECTSLHCDISAMTAGWQFPFAACPCWFLLALGSISVRQALSKSVIAVRCFCCTPTDYAVCACLRFLCPTYPAMDDHDLPSNSPTDRLHPIVLAPSSTRFPPVCTQQPPFMHPVYPPSALPHHILTLHPSPSQEGADGPGGVPAP
jgi:hypothetical protein